MKARKNRGSKCEKGGEKGGEKGVEKGGDKGGEKGGKKEAEDNKSNEFVMV